MSVSDGYSCFEKQYTVLEIQNIPAALQGEFYFVFFNGELIILGQFFNNRKLYDIFS